MKKIIYPLILILIFFCFGCGSKENSAQSVDNSATDDTSVQAIDTKNIEADDSSMQVQIANAITADIQIQNIDLDVDAGDAMCSVILDDTYQLMLDVCEGEYYSGIYKQLDDTIEYVYDMDYEIIGEDVFLYVQLDSAYADVDCSDFNFYDVETYRLELLREGYLEEYTFFASDVVANFMDMVSAGTFLFPQILPRVAEDDIYFTPLSDDYAYFVESQSANPDNFSSNLSACLIDFDENSNVGRMVQRSPNYNEGVGEDGICTQYYYEEVQFSKFMTDIDPIARQYFTTDKEILRTCSIKNFAAGYISKPEISGFSFESNNDVADFQLLDYYTPATDDYFIQEFVYITDQTISQELHAIILEFDSDGSTLDRIYLMMIPEENTYSLTVANENWTLLDAENRVYQCSASTYVNTMGVQNQLKQSKQNLVHMFVNNGQLNSYEETMNVQNLAWGFSMPYFTEEQLALYNQSLDTGIWVNSLIFENHYDDKITYTIQDDIDPNAYQKWVISYIDGLAYSSYNVFQFSGGTVHENTWFLDGNIRVYENRDLAYYQDIYFFSNSKYALTKDEVKDVLEAEVNEYGLFLVSVEEGGIDITSKIESDTSYLNCIQVSYPTQAQLASYVPKDTTPTGDGIYASGISEFEGDALYFTPLTDDWEVEFDKKYPDLAYLYSYDVDGNMIQKLERHVTEADFTVGPETTEVFTPEEYQENTYANVSNAYYFNVQVYSSPYGGSSDKQGRMTYFAENIHHYDHYFSSPDVTMD